MTGVQTCALPIFAEKDVGDMIATDVTRGIETAKDRVWGKSAYA